MTAEAIELFYIYSRKDDVLRKRLDTHLSTLKREDLLSTWHDQEIIPGSLWEKEISKHLHKDIVDFIVASVDEVLQRDFGKSLSTPGVKILDPCVGTGNFIVNIIKRIRRGALREKFANDLFCNEITLLPYYIASLNIEHEYYDIMGEYRPFEGICFADTLELAEELYNEGKNVLQQPKLFIVEANAERVKREKEADIMVVIGNPPYNLGQKSENENN